MRLLTAADLSKISVINLRHREDRWAAVQSHLLADLGWGTQLIRHLATDTRDWDQVKEKFASMVAPESMAALCRPSRLAANDLTPGAVGCLLSHLSLWTQLAESRDDELLFIIEDDVVWNDEVPRLGLDALVDQVNALPVPWDILLLGGTPIHYGPAGPSSVQIHFFWETHAYIVRKSAAVRLIQCALPVHQPVDWVMSQAAQQGLSLLMLVPGLMGQRGGHYTDPRRRNDSDIQNLPTVP